MSRRGGFALGLVAVLLALGLVVALFPANWVAQWVAGRSAGRVLLGDARGTLWAGSAVLGFQDEGGAAMALPGRLVWRLGLAGPATVHLELEHAGVLAAPVAVRLALRLAGGAGEHVELEVGPGAAQLPLGLLAAAGAPFNSLRPEGQARLRWDTLGLAAGRPRGQGSVDFERLSLALSPVRPLGDYRLGWDLGGDGLRWTLGTLTGALRLQGKGAWSWVDGVRFAGAAAPDTGIAPELARQLQTLLDVLGPRDGAGVRIRIGAGAERLT